MNDISEWITGRQVCAKLKIEPWLLLDLVESEKLQAFDPFDRKEIDPDHVRLVSDEELRTKFELKKSLCGDGAAEKLEFKVFVEDIFNYLAGCFQVEDCFFIHADVDSLEKSDEQTDKRELARLKAKVGNVEQAIEAAIALVVYCRDFLENEGRLLKRAEGQDFVTQNYKRVTDDLFDYIWKHVPKDLKQPPGRPRKE